MNALIRFIPNLFTLANLFSGFTALVLIAREQMVWAVVWVGIALVLDFLDGFVARLLNAQSEIGVQLDSLADLVTFGVVSGFMLYQMIVIQLGYYFVPVNEWSWDVWLQASVAGVIPMAAAYRLAKFNLKEGPSSHFEGLPTPAMSMVVVGIPLALESNFHLNFYHPLSQSFIDLLGDERRWSALDVGVVKALNNPSTYQMIAVLLAVMMVSRLPMISLKFKGLSWSANKWRYALLIWAVVSYLIFLIPYLWWLPFSYPTVDYLILPIFMLGYFLLSSIYATFEVRKTK